MNEIKSTQMHEEKETKGITRQRRTAIWVSSITAILFMVVTVYSAIAGMQNLGSMTGAYVTGAISLIGLISALVSWRVNSDLGVLILTGMILLGGIAVNVLIAGQGLFVMILMLIISTGLALTSLSPHLVQRTIIVAVVLSVTAFVLDLTLPLEARETGNLPITLGITIVMVLLYVIMINSQYSKFPMRTKLIYGFVGASVLSVLAVIIVTAIYTLQFQQQQTDRGLLLAARGLAITYDNFIQTNLRTIRSEASIQDVREVLELPPSQRAGGSARDHAFDALITFREKDSLFITSYKLLDTAGLSVLETNLLRAGTDYSTYDYFTEPLSNGESFVSPVRYRDDGKQVFHFSAPVFGSNGEAIGVLVAEYQAILLQLILYQSAAQVSNQSFGVLLDEYNIILAHGGNADLISKAVGTLDAATISTLLRDERLPEVIGNNFELGQAGVVAALRSDNPIFINDQTGTDQSIRGAFYRLSLAPWLVLYNEPTELAITPNTGQGRILSIVAVVTAFAAAVLALLLSRVLAQPISRLTEAASRITAGDYQFKVPVEAQDEVGSLANTINTMTDQISDLISSLEEGVMSRTRALEISADVSRRLSTILDADELLSTVVQEVKTAFDYYHVHIYLFDANKEMLRMVGGTGEAGRIMLQRKHEIRSGKGLVGRAAENNEVVLVPDVSKAIGWLPNDLLPETRSEIAVPIAIGENVIGVLDVQQNRVEGLQDTDSVLLQSVAGQVAVAIQNAQAYAKAQKQANREALAGEIRQRLQRATTIEDVLQTAVQELGQAIQAPRARVKLELREDGPNGSRVRASGIKE